MYCNTKMSYVYIHSLWYFALQAKILDFIGFSREKYSKIYEVQLVKFFQGHSRPFIDFWGFFKVFSKSMLNSRFLRFSRSAINPGYFCRFLFRLWRLRLSPQKCVISLNSYSSSNYLSNDVSYVYLRMKADETVIFTLWRHDTSQHRFSKSHPSHFERVWSENP